MATMLTQRLDGWPDCFKLGLLQGPGHSQKQQSIAAELLTMTTVRKVHSLLACVTKVSSLRVWGQVLGSNMLMQAVSNSSRFTPSLCLPRAIC